MGKTKESCLVALGVTGLLLVSHAARAADAITLRDGSVMRGEIVQETDDAVVLKIKFGTMTYKRTEIASIEKGGDAAAAGAASAARAADWRDVVRLKSGDEQVGLIVSEDKGEIVFDIVMSGKTVSKTLLARTTIPKSEVESIERLTDEERLQAREYLRSVKQEAMRDAVAEKELVLEAIEFTPDEAKAFNLKLKDGVASLPAKKVDLEHFVIVGGLEQRLLKDFEAALKGKGLVSKSFDLEVNEDFLKRAAFRLAKVFGAYKRHFGVDRNEGRKVHVVLFDSYGAYYAAIGKKFTNPAFYSPDFKIIWAGCSLAEYAAGIAAARKHNAELNKRLEEYRAKIDKSRAELRRIVDGYYRQIVKAGRTTPYGKAIMQQIRREELKWQLVLLQWEKPAKKIQKEIEDADRRMDLLFDKHTQNMIRGIYHEGFHAFLDQFLFDEKTVKQVPLWLNEGLSMYFESARVEGRRLILGQERRDWLAILRRFRREGKLVPLEKLVAAGSKDFLVHDVKDAEKSSVHYLQSWCLVHLLGEKGRLEKEHLDAYVRALAGKTPPAEALGILAGKSARALQADFDAKLGATIRFDGAGAE